MGFIALQGNVDPQPAPAKPSGGINVDNEARAAIDAIIDSLVEANVYTP